MSLTESTVFCPRDKWRRWRTNVLRAVRASAVLLWYSARLNLGLPAVVLLLAAVGVFAATALSDKIGSEKDIFQILLALESLLFVGLSMGLLPREKEGGTLEVLLVCARSRHGLLLMKLAPVFLFIALIGMMLTTAYSWLHGGFSWLRMFGVPWLLAAVVGMLTVVLTTYLRNQYAAATVAVLLALIAATFWLDPFTTFYRASVRPMQQPPNLAVHRVLAAVALVVLYDHAVRRLKHIELWMR